MCRPSIRTASLALMVPCLLLAATLVGSNDTSARPGFGYDRAASPDGRHGGFLKVQSQRRYPGRGRGGGRGPRFGGGGFSIVIPLPGGDYDPPPRRRRHYDDEPRRRTKPKARTHRRKKHPPRPPVIVARPQPRPQGVPPAPIGPLQGDRRPRDVLVTLAAGTPDNVVTELAQAHRLSRQSSFASPTLGVSLARYRIPDRRSLAQVLNQLAQDARVVAVQPVYLYYSTQGAAGKATVVPQYAADKLRLAEAHRMARGRDVRVVIIDTGVDATHPELKGTSIESMDAIGKGKPHAEPHGTAIAGIVGARQQLQGMAPDADILAVRAFSRIKSGRVEGTTETLIKAVDMGLAKQGRLFNLSFTGPRDPSVEEILRIAESKGAIFIAAAGNGGPDAPAAYPGAYETVLAVTAVDDHDKLYKAANRGSYIDVAAPGVDILAPAPKRGYELSSGTSLAAAHVSGIVALLMELKPDLRRGDILKLLSESARDEAGWAKQDFGAGVVDAARALEALR